MSGEGARLVLPKGRVRFACIWTGFQFESVVVVVEVAAVAESELDSEELLVLVVPAEVWFGCSLGDDDTDVRVVADSSGLGGRALVVVVVEVVVVAAAVVVCGCLLVVVSPVVVVVAAVVVVVVAALVVDLLLVLLSKGISNGVSICMAGECCWPMAFAGDCTTLMALLEAEPGGGPDGAKPVIGLGGCCCCWGCCCCGWFPVEGLPVGGGIRGDLRGWPKRLLLPLFACGLLKFRCGISKRLWLLLNGFPAPPAGSC